MGNYSKLVGAFVGSGLALGAALGLPADWATPEVGAGITGVFAMIFTYAFPANRQ
ncbi:MAG: hypothetical protein GY943_30345 [Chloroflexi bacterium]|nr:hypothetical protein [Chloroflexota bacterium]